MIRAIIADDEHHVRRSLQGHLRELVPHVTVVGEAGTGDELIELCRRHRPDLLFIDIKMPGLDGLAAAEQLRSEFPDAMMVFLTAYDRFDFVQRALRIGAADFLLKPVRRRDVAAALSRIAPMPEQPDISESSQEETIARARDYIEQNYTRSLSLKEVAEHVHVSPCHLSRVFHRVTGETFSSHLLARRLSTAKRLLATTNKTCRSVAAAAGFRSCGHFSTVFKREIGVSPTAYRARHRAQARDKVIGATNQNR